MMRSIFLLFSALLQTCLDVIEIFFYKITVPIFEWKQQRWVRHHTYQNDLFKRLDTDLIQGGNPYRDSKVFPYGETPLQALYVMGQKAQLSSKDIVVDLGCGRGRGVFFFSHMFGCFAEGVDLTRSFICKANELANTYRVSNVSFKCKDFLDYDLNHATCIYLYGITYPSQTFAALEKKFQALALHSQLIIIDQPLSSFLVQNPHEKSFSFQVKFNWGKADVFLYEKISDQNPMFIVK